MTPAVLDVSGMGITDMEQLISKKFSYQKPVYFFFVF
jgi:hypothetical protein